MDQRTAQGLGMGVVIGIVAGIVVVIVEHGVIVPALSPSNLQPASTAAPSHETSQPQQGHSQVARNDQTARTLRANVVATTVTNSGLPDVKTATSDEPPIGGTTTDSMLESVTTSSFVMPSDYSTSHTSEDQNGAGSDNTAQTLRMQQENEARRRAALRDKEWMDRLESERRRTEAERAAYIEHHVRGGRMNPDGTWKPGCSEAGCNYTYSTATQRPPW